MGAGSCMVAVRPFSSHLSVFDAEYLQEDIGVRASPQDVRSLHFHTVDCQRLLFSYRDLRHARQCA
eukprot:scaffold29593_cov22-Tisochrysis_lutea.AAC.3